MRGSVFKRCQHSRQTWPCCRHSWTVVVSAGKDPTTGKTVQVWETVQGSRTDADQRLVQLLHDAGTGSLAAGRRTALANYLEDWLQHTRTRVRPQTWDRYAALMRQQVVPRIGTIELGNLRPNDVQRVVDGMLKKGSAPRSVVQCYRVLSSSLRQAVRWQLINTNPAVAVQPPRPVRPDLEVPDGDKLKRLIEQAKGTRLELPVMLAAATGLRRGEILGLRWSDVEDADGACVARVVGSIQRIEGELVRVEPKSDRARRTVAVPRQLAELLRTHRLEQTERRLLIGEDWADTDLIIERGDGSPSDPDGLTHAFGKLAARAGLPGVRLHDLRHAYASALLRHDVHPKVVSEALGHSSTAFTMDVYQHLVPSMQRAAADAIEAELG